ncbi:MAG: Heme A synthase, cytochrome oxidase biogenesis protein Cox15-CtaA [Burkholderiaceae bacterium]|jgi:cytochrome c oxidase assembly protein subunit 15|nr:MAG: Heme A synthase, cytochrome oxidase biogenesis protein Cox15-CtaA [Burkholderiaceae bacterium]
MTNPPLYNLSPIAQIMFAGVLAALGPLAWLWLRNRRAGGAQWLRALALLTLFLCFDLVLFGAFTRLTDSGLGCPDWPGCYGNASPVGASSAITLAQTAMPTGPVTHGKAWVEMIHRYLATGVGVLILALAVVAWVQWRRAARRPDFGAAPAVHPWWPTLTLAWVCLQGAFGALTVTMRLFPAIVTLHLLGGMVLLALLCAQAVRANRAVSGRVPTALPRLARSLLLLTCALVACQIALGGWVSTNYAVLACREFPMCQGSWWPTMDFHQGFSLWRPLGMTPAGHPIEFSALTAIHYVHRLFAYLVIVVLGWLAWRLRATGLRRQARWIAALALWQFGTGLSNVVLGWPLPAAVGHTGGAAALVVVLTWSVVASRRVQPARESAATDAGAAQSPPVRLPA